MKKKKDTSFSLSVEQQLLVEQHTSMAMKLGRNYRNFIHDPAFSMEDLQQEACMGLCMAAIRFDPAKGACFSTYATYWCEKRILETVNKEKVMPEDDEWSLTDEEEETEKAEERLARLERAMRRLTAQERKIISYAHGLHGEPVGFREIGRKLKLSVKRVKDIYENAMIQLEQTL